MVNNYYSKSKKYLQEALKISEDADNSREFKARRAFRRSLFIPV